MTDGPRSQRLRGKAQRAARPSTRASKEAKRKLEELSPDRRAELAQQIEAKQFRGKPPSI